MRNWLISIIGLCALGCSQPPTLETDDRAILGGEPDLTEEFPGACAMRVVLPPDEDDEPQDPILCSCSLIQKDAEGPGAGATVLTSARCVNENVEAGTLANIDVRFGRSFEGALATDKFGVTSVELHRYFDPDASGVDELALLRLDGVPGAGSPVVTLNETPLSDADIDRDVYLVGSGVTDDDATDDGQRHSVTVPLRSVRDLHVLAGTADSTTCVGDSGGPVYVEVGTDFVQIAMTIRQFQGCSESVRRLRIDRYLEDFIHPFVDRFEGDCTIDGMCVEVGCRTPDPDCDECAWGNTCKEDCPTRDWDCDIGQFVGQVCEVSGECEEFGRCVVSHDDDQFSYCSRPCEPGKAGDCPAGMVCLEDGDTAECVFDPATPSRGSQGAECTSGAQCRSEICEEGICVVECDSSDATACDSEFGTFTCGPSTVQSGTNVCLGRVISGGGGFCSPEDESNGGFPCCAIVQPDDGPGTRLGALLLVALALGVARRRRRR